MLTRAVSSRRGGGGSFVAEGDERRDGEVCWLSGVSSVGGCPDTLSGWPGMRRGSLAGAGSVGVSWCDGVCQIDPLQGVKSVVSFTLAPDWKRGGGSLCVSSCHATPLAVMLRLRKSGGDLPPPPSGGDAHGRGALPDTIAWICCSFYGSV